MHHDSIRAVADRLEKYFDWYLRVDPDVTPAHAAIVDRFVQLATGPTSTPEAKALLEASDGMALGSAWEEMRATLRVLAHA